MLKKFVDLLSGLSMTIIGGIFLLASFILPRTGFPKCVNLAWATIFISGIPLLYLAIIRIIINKGISKISSALLISLAMIASIMIDDLFASGEVAFIMAIGAIFEDKTKERAKKGLNNLIFLTPKTGRVIRDGKESQIEVTQIVKGDLLRILPGETIPVDGIIIDGETSDDQSVMTGESLPIDKIKGDTLYSGTINRFGSVEIEATKTGENSSLQKLIRMVEKAEKKQALIQQIADKWASLLVPVALLIAIAVYLITGNIVRAVTVMVVFCPCALVLATPTAIMAAIGQATKRGVIIKSAEALEHMGSVTIIAFDKTGTLTFGKLEVSDVIPLEEIDANELLAITASAENLSEHPLGKAIAEKAKLEKIYLYETTNFRMTAGKGISADINNEKYCIGNEKFLIENSIPLDEKGNEALETLRSQGKASVIVANTKVIGIIALSDVIRPNLGKIIKKLSKMSTKSVLLTGDNIKSAEYFANIAGIKEIYADLLQEEKVEKIDILKQFGKVCMVGDGVNDAPALKIADVGVAMSVMGSDSEAGIEHFGRGVDAAVDKILMIVDPSFESLELSSKIYKMAKDINKKTQLSHFKKPSNC